MTSKHKAKSLHLRRDSQSLVSAAIIGRVGIAGFCWRMESADQAGSAIHGARELADVTTVPSGAAEVVRKQQEGLGYFKP